MIKWLMDRWREALFIVFVGTAAVGVATEKKAYKQMKVDVARLNQIAVNSQDPHVWLHQWLTAHSGVDTTQARVWSQMQIGPVPDSAGNPIPNLPYLLRGVLPEKGVLVMDVGDSIITIQTLWHFPVKEAKK